jgi:hypothetical protein
MKGIEMPKILKFYGCSYNCGYESKMYEEVEDHEETCIHNPDYKFCDWCVEINNRGKDFGIFGKYKIPLEDSINEACRTRFLKCEECLQEQRTRKELIEKYITKNDPLEDIGFTANHSYGYQLINEVTNK